MAGGAPSSSSGGAAIAIRSATEMPGLGCWGSAIVRGSGAVCGVGGVDRGGREPEQASVAPLHRLEPAHRCQRRPLAASNLLALGQTLVKT